MVEMVGVGTYFSYSFRIFVIKHVEGSSVF